MANEFLGSSSESLVESLVESSSEASCASVSAGSVESSSANRPRRSRRPPSGPTDAHRITDDDFRQIPRR